MPAVVNRRSLFLLALCAAALIAALVVWLRPGWVSGLLGWDDEQWEVISFFTVVACGIVAVVTFLWGVLTYYLRPTDFSHKKDIIQLIAQTLGGATLIITLFSTWQGVRENEAKLEENRKTSEETMEMARQTLAETRLNRLAERYSRATDQLGSKDRGTRIGAIYALGQIASDSDEFYWPVVQLITSYVAENAPWKGVSRPADQIPADIQAAMNVLAWRRKKWGAGEDAPLELRGTDFRGLILKNRDGVPDGGAHFEGARLDKAHFESETAGEGQRTNLRGIHFEEAVLDGADLRNAYLSGAYLRGAGLAHANIEGADLSLAQGLTPDQVMTADNFECALYDPAFTLALEQALGRKLNCPKRSE